MSNDPKHDDREDRTQDGPHIAPEPLDPEPLAVDSDDLNEFIDHYEQSDPDPDQRDVRTDVQPPG